MKQCRCFGRLGLLFFKTLAVVSITMSQEEGLRASSGCGNAADDLLSFCFVNECGL